MISDTSIPYKNMSLAEMSNPFDTKASNDQELFTYHPLNQDGDQASIRLIKVKADLHESGLIQVVIRHSTVSANYTAVSYVWGEQVERHCVLINHRIATVGSNLHKHLSSLRSFERGQWFWVDALSIDQEDAAERSQQVKLMAEIFEGAEEVLAFISPDPDYGDPPEPPFETLVAQSELYTRFEDSTRPIVGASLRDREVRVDRHAFGALNVDVTAICRSKYWDRTWIIQEIALARKLYLTDGRTKSSWEDFYGSIDVLLTLHEQDSLRIQVPPALTRLQDLRKGTRRSSLAALVSDFSESKCSDFHDKVYGLLSMLQNGHRYPVDYQTNKLGFFLDALKFGRRLGASFYAEQNAFVLAPTLYRSLSSHPQTLVEQAEAASEMPTIRCRAEKASLKQSYDWWPSFYKCPYCGYKTPCFDTLNFNVIYCLEQEGSCQHLISEEPDSLEAIQNLASDQIQMALVIMVAAFQQDIPDAAPFQVELLRKELVDWNFQSPFSYWNAEHLRSYGSNQVDARCQMLKQKISIPKLNSNGLFYEIDLPVPVFMSMSVRDTMDVESLVGRYAMPGAPVSRRRLAVKTTNQEDLPEVEEIN